MSNNERVVQLERQLNDFDAGRRKAALDELMEMVRGGELEFPAASRKVNLHAHSFHSYNAWGYSPSSIAWRGRREGLMAVGLVDFDVLDGVDEFFAATAQVGIASMAGMETRAYIPEFSAREINSPGEPGIAYHMGCGFIRSDIDDPWAREFASTIRRNAQSRNREMIGRVNEYLSPVEIDYQADLLPLSPSGTPTERHICEAYYRKAAAMFSDRKQLTAYWCEKLGLAEERVLTLLDDAAALQAAIRSKTMKRGGVGYVQPTADTFPLMSDMNRFAMSLGAVPTLTWLDGTSRGEQDIEELMALEMRHGVAAVNIIPDRNWNIADSAAKEVKLQKLREIVSLADSKGLPVIVGTEMNAPGLKFVDDFDAPELAPVIESFVRGAWIMIGHTVAAMNDGRGYLSPWAQAKFASVSDKNDYFEELGRKACGAE